MTKYLGTTKNEFEGFDTIDFDRQMDVEYKSDEVTALCPKTGQPDWYVVQIMLNGMKGLESKSLKLYLQSFRNQGIYCESFACRILDDVVAAVEPESAYVIVEQKPRGGVSIRAEADYNG